MVLSKKNVKENLILYLNNHTITNNQYKKLSELLEQNKLDITKPLDELMKTL